MIKKRKNSFQLFAVLCCLLIIQLSLLTSYSEFSHSEHAHENVHTLENEQDACHRAIYHGEFESEHEAHIHQKENNCSLCLISVPVHTNTVYLPESPFEITFSLLDEQPELELYLSSFSTNKNKAPPTTV